MILEKFFKKVIPKQIKEDTLEYSYAKNIAGSAAIATVAIFFFALFFYYLYFPYGAVVLLVEGFFIFMCVMLMRFIHPLFWIREMVVSSMLITLALLSYSMGGIFSPVSYWLILPPLAALFYGGRVTSVCWGFVSITILLTMYLFERWHYPFPQSPITNLLFLQYESISGLTIVLLASAYFFERANREHSEKMSEMNQKLRASIEHTEILARQAQEASIAKSTFLAAMSHEIRTPLNGVLGMTEILLESIISDDQRKCLEVIQFSGNSLLSIINNVLDFSKIEAGHIELESIPFELKPLLFEVIGTISVQVRNKEIQFEAIMEPEIPAKLIGDPGKLKQILTNLLMNAVKFTEKGTIKINLKLLQQLKNEVVVKFEVIDTGIGMTQEMRSRLFKQFSQGDASVSRKYGGTGLGLAISQRLVEVLGGTITVESKVGKGSKFWFTLPFRLS